MSRKLSALTAIFMAVLLVVACGDDENNPQGGGTNPTASTLTAAADQNTVTLTWTQCPDDDFAGYNLYRSTSSGIAADPSSAAMVATVSDVSTLAYEDTGLEWNTDYYYALQTVDSSQLTSWSNEAAVTTPDSSGGGGGEVLTCYDIQGQAVESPYEGDDVTVTGIVTSAAGELYSSGDGKLVSIMDPSGGQWSGLLLYGFDGIMDSLERGDSVVVSGYVQEYYELTEVVVQSVDFVESEHTVPGPEAITTVEIDREEWEGVFVSISDVTVTTDPDQYGQFDADDGSGPGMVKAYDYATSTGETFSEIIGILVYTYSEYKIETRDDNDLTP
ncbi:hypothetical protein CSA37_07690 [Candidatus Fermentibacteria bacterium]|nr:MAG: hypothetical protein CSA37_07690 [Candidatus Fermentibacteria bacterium]